MIVIVDRCCIVVGIDDVVVAVAAAANWVDIVAIDILTLVQYNLLLIDG